MIGLLKYFGGMRRSNFGNTLVVIGILFLGAVATAATVHRFSEIFIMEMDPASKKELGDKKYNDVLAFFKKAETAIETKNLDDLIALYADDYSNGKHGKEAASKIWKRIFETFDNMATRHNMSVVTSAYENVLILQCTGLLVGTPKGKNYNITIDSWNNQDHIITDEDGSWKLLGTTGVERQRLWFDKPMHPLF